MKKESITTFLKVMSIITLIWSVLGVLISALAVFVAPLAEETTGEAYGMMTWITLAVTAICEIVNFVLAIMALQHKKIDLVYKISTFTLMALIVFNVVDGGGIGAYLATIAGAIIPALFAVSAGGQNKIDQAQ